MTWSTQTAGNQSSSIRYHALLPPAAGEPEGDSHSDVENRMGSLRLVEMKTLVTGCVHQHLEIPPFLSIPPLTEQPPVFVLNVS